MITYSSLYKKFTRSISVLYFAAFGLNTKIYWQQHVEHVFSLNLNNNIYKANNNEIKVTSTDIGLESFLAK